MNPDPPPSSRMPHGFVTLVVLLVLGAIYGALGVARDHVSIRARSRLDGVVRWWPWRSNIGHGSEVDAVVTLRNLASAQAQFSASAAVDRDRDGLGEFGTFAELSGAVALRGRGISLNPPVLSGVFRTGSAGGVVRRSGYELRLHLPTSDGVAGVDGVDADPDASERRWCAYAWPTRFDYSGLRTFAIDHNGEIWATTSELYDGPSGPAPDAAYAPDAGGQIGDAMSGIVGADGNVWRRIN